MSFSLGDIQINDPVFLAPMSGITDLPFRRLVKRYGAGLVFSEMIASREMVAQKSKSQKINAQYEEEFPIAVQLAGCDPDIMAEAARLNVDRGASIIDINFGCPVKKVVNKMAGSALMQDEDLATRIMEATVRAVDIPVTVKMRLGWNAENLNAPSLAKRAEDVGIQMVTVHGRTREQRYKGTANWHAIAAVKQAISVPLIVNGDIDTPQNAVDALKQSGADGVMIGRGCQGKPWLLKQVMSFMKTGEIGQEPDTNEKLNLIIEHYNSILEHYGERKGTSLARKHLASYCNQIPGAAAFRAEINTMNNPETVRDALRDFFRGTPNIA